MITEADLLRLEVFLHSEPIARSSMSIPMIDGMLTAAVIGPRPIMPSEFIPWIWDHEEGVTAPDFRDEAEAHDVYSLIIAMQNRIASDLMRRPPGFMPLFLLREEWSHLDWYNGFEIGMNFDVDAWEAAVDARKRFFGPIVSFSDPDVRQSAGQDWPDLVASLPRAVIGFRDYFRGETRAEFFAAHTPVVRKDPKVGRNEACPCGSGKKYKKCCGQSGGTVH